MFVDVSSIRIGRAFALDCLSGYRSAPQPRKRKRIYERETVASCMAGSMRPQHATIGGINQNHLRAEGSEGLFVFVLSLSAGSIKIISEWKVSRQSQSIAYLG